MLLKLPRTNSKVQFTVNEQGQMPCTWRDLRVPPFTDMTVRQWVIAFGRFEGTTDYLVTNTDFSTGGLYSAAIHRGRCPLRCQDVNVRTYKFF